MLTLPMILLFAGSLPEQEAADPSWIQPLVTMVTQDVREAVMNDAPGAVGGPTILDIASLVTSAQRAGLDGWDEASVRGAWTGRVASRGDAFKGDYAAHARGEVPDERKGTWIEGNGLYVAVDSLRLRPTGEFEVFVSYAFTSTQEMQGRPQLGCAEVLYVLEPREGRRLVVLQKVPLAVC